MCNATTYLSSFSKASKVRSIPLRLIRRRRPAATRRRLRNRGWGGLGRGDARVDGLRDTETGLRLAGQRGGRTHGRRTLLVHRAKLDAVGATGSTARRTAIGHVAGGACRADGDGGFSVVIALGGTRSAIDNGHSGRLVMLHGRPAVHRRDRGRLSMVSTSSSTLRRTRVGLGGLLGGVGVRPGGGVGAADRRG